MKLWQKIFLLTLTLVIIVVNTSSLLLLSNNHSLAIAREQQNALARHNYLLLELQNTIIYTQLVENKVTLTDEEALKVASDVLERQRSDSSMGISLYQNRELFKAVNQNGIATHVDLLSASDFSSVIEEAQGAVTLYLVSTVALGTQSFQLITSSDVSSTYALFRIDFDQIRLIGVMSALVVAGILLLLVRGLLNPLRNLSSTTHRIASGDLYNRATVKGHDEVAEVARSFNTMADSIENNVSTLEELAESRKVFIANLAHEMKTPLTSILGFADILRVKREVTDEERIEYASVIVGETKRLQGLSGKLMELLTLGNLQLTSETVEIHDFASELATILHPITKIHDIKLITELPEEAVSIRVDKELMKSLIFNLVDNSIKASSTSSTVRLIFALEKSVESTADEKQVDERNRANNSNNNSSAQERECVRITVIDEGIGIPTSEIPYLVEPFYMLDKARTRKHGGAGLGLALCSEIAQAHSSKLEITSRVGVGTEVSMLIKREREHD